MSTTVVTKCEPFINELLDNVIPCIEKMKTKYIVCAGIILLLVWFGNYLFLWYKLTDKKKKEQRLAAVVVAHICSSFLIVFLSFLFLIIFKLTPLASLLIQFTTWIIRNLKKFQKRVINFLLVCEGKNNSSDNDNSDNDNPPPKSEEHYWDLFTRLNEKIFDFHIFDSRFFRKFKDHDQYIYKIGFLFFLIALTNIPTVISWSTSSYEFYHIFWGIMLLVILINIVILILYLLPLIMLIMSYNRPLYKLIKKHSDTDIETILKCFEEEKEKKKDR